LKIHIVAGWPGSGKTYARTKGSLEHLLGYPVVDLDDLFRSGVDNWLQRIHYVENFIVDGYEKQLEAIVIEGIFNHDSRSRKLLESFLNHLKHDGYALEVEWHWMDTSFVNCAQNLFADYVDNEDEYRLIGRMFLLSKYAGGYR
jgi:hypothetical protein